MKKFKMKDVYVPVAVDSLIAKLEARDKKAKSTTTKGGK